MGTKPLTQTTGRRKSAIARARLRPGTGKVTVNGRTFENYFPNEVQRAQATEALRVIEDRIGRQPRLMSSRRPIDYWHDLIGDRLSH